MPRGLFRTPPDPRALDRLVDRLQHRGGGVRRLRALHRDLADRRDRQQLGAVLLSHRGGDDHVPGRPQNPRDGVRAVALTGSPQARKRSRMAPIMDSIRRTIVTTGAAATAMAATPRVFAQQTGQGGAAMSFYEKGPVRIHYEEAGSGLPLLLIAGGGLNSTIAALANPLNPIEEVKGEYRCIPSGPRNANAGPSSAP